VISDTGVRGHFVGVRVPPTSGPVEEADHATLVVAGACLDRAGVTVVRADLAAGDDGCTDPVRS
jgi:hypothetical protein